MLNSAQPVEGVSWQPSRRMATILPPAQAARPQRRTAPARWEDGASKVLCHHAGGHHPAARSSSAGRCLSRSLKARWSPLPRSADRTIVTRARREHVGYHCRPHPAPPGFRLQPLPLSPNRLPNPSTTAGAPAHAHDWTSDQSRPGFDSGPDGVFGRHRLKGIETVWHDDGLRLDHQAPTPQSVRDAAVGRTRHAVPLRVCPRLSL